MIWLYCLWAIMSASMYWKCRVRQLWPKTNNHSKNSENSSVPKLCISIAISKRWGHLSPQTPLPPPIINIFWSVSPAQRCTLSMNNGDVLLPVDAHRACQWACKSRGRWRWRGWGLKWRGRSIHTVFDIINGKLTITAVLQCASEQILSLQWSTICSDSFVVSSLYNG